MILVIGTRLEGHSVILLAIQTPPSCRSLLALAEISPNRDDQTAAFAHHRPGLRVLGVAPSSSSGGPGPSWAAPDWLPSCPCRPRTSSPCRRGSARADIGRWLTRSGGRESVYGGAADELGGCCELRLVAISGHSSAPWWSNFRPSDGCGRNAVVLAVAWWCNCSGFGAQRRNVELTWRMR